MQQLLEMPKRIEIDDSVLARLEANCPKYLSPTGFANLLIDQSLTRRVDYAPTVSVRDTGLSSLSPTKQAVQKETSAAPSGAQSTVHSSVEKNLPSVPSLSIGEGVGMESEEGQREGNDWTPRKHRPDLPSVSRSKVVSSRQPRANLSCHCDLIAEFWKCKAGAKSDKAWAFFQTELTKIQKKYGDRVLRDQLELATASRWKSVTLKNYEQFGLNKPMGKPEFDWDSINGVSI